MRGTVILLAALALPVLNLRIAQADERTVVYRSTPVQKAPLDLGCAPCGLREGDELWVVSTRGLQDPRCGVLGTPNVRSYECGYGWNESSWETLCSAPARPTVIYIHGNRFNYGDSIVAGWTVYRLLVQDPTAEPLRLVIWSWPSDQLHGPVRDARVKSHRADHESYFVAWYLGSIVEPAPISMIGYSLGARIILGGLQARTLGHWNGIGLPEEASTRELVPTRVALLAAAVDYDGLLPGRDYDRALAAVDRMLITTNRADPVLKRYHLLEGRRTQRALGSLGVASLAGLGWMAERIEQLNASGIVGRSHDDDRYYASPYVAEQLRRTLLWRDG